MNSSTARTSTNGRASISSGIDEAYLARIPKATRGGGLKAESLQQAGKP